jgi:hypothetical protein
MMPWKDNDAPATRAHQVAHAIAKRFAQIGVDLRLDYTRTSHDLRSFSVVYTMSFKPRKRINVMALKVDDLINWTEGRVPELRVIMRVPIVLPAYVDKSDALAGALKAVDGIVIYAILKRAATDVARGATIVLEV